MLREDAVKLVCSLLDPSFDKGALETKLKQFSEEDWATINEAAGSNGLSLLLYYRLKVNALLGTVPDSIRSTLEALFLAATARNMRMFHHAGEILQALRDHQVDVIALKGLYLAEVVYPSIGIRPFGDLDLLVRKVDLDHGLAVLQELGYKLSTFYDPNDPNRDIKHLPPLIRENGPIVELHWNILEEDTPFDISIDDLWCRSQPVKVAGVEVLALGPEDMILHLCIHATYQHGLRGGIRPLHDIAAVLQKRKNQIRWEELAHTASEWGVQRVVWLTLRLVQEVTGVGVSVEFMKNLLGEPKYPSIIEEARELLFTNEGAIALTPDLAALQSLKGSGAKIQLILSRIFLPRRIMARLYNVNPHSIKVNCYYLVRFWDLLRFHGRSGWGMVRREHGIQAGVDREKISARLGVWMVG